MCSKEINRSAKVYLSFAGLVDGSGEHDEAKVSARRVSNLSFRKGKQPSSVLCFGEAIAAVVGLVL